MANIVIVGSINMDLVVRASRIPKPGETVLGSDFGTFPGGKGANQAVAAARQGAQVRFVGRVGADEFGKQLLACLEADHVKTEFIGQDPSHPSGVALITLDQAGQNSIVVSSGANFLLAPEHVQAAGEAFTDADMLLLQLETPLETVLAAVRQAKEMQKKVILNPAPAQPLPAELYPQLDVIIPNETEAALLTGLPVDTLEQAESAARALVERGVNCAIITLGERGALMASAGRPPFHQPSFPVQVVDTTSAGDTFVGVFSAALAEGLSLEAALLRGCAAGALTTTRLGAQQSIPNRAEVDRFLADRRV